MGTTFREFINEVNYNVGDKVEGGIYIGKHNGVHLVMAEKDAPRELKGDEAVKYCSNLSIDGYSDWHLPSTPELYFTRKKALKYFTKGKIYWASEQGSGDTQHTLNFYGTQKEVDDQYQVALPKNNRFFVRAFRSFK